MKSVILFFLLCSLTGMVYAQQKLRDCSEQKHAALAEILFSGKPLDSSSNRLFNELDRKWTECIQGKETPKFNVQSLDGKRFNLDSLKGKVALINFWYIACEPCIAEIPLFNKLVDNFKGQDMVFLAFASDNKAALSKFINKFPFSFSIIPQAAKTQAAFGIQDFPVSFLIDKEGRVSFGWMGGITLETQEGEIYARLKKRIEKLVGIE